MGRKTVIKERVDLAAIELFATKGIVATTIKDIATKASVSEGALYRHYSSKIEMGWSLYSREVIRFVEEFSALLNDNCKSYMDRFKNAWQYIYAYYEGNAISFDFIMFTQHSFPDHNLEDNKNNPYYVIKSFLEAGTLAGEFKVENSGVTTANLLGLAIQPLAFKRYGMLDSTLDEICTSSVKAGEAILS